MAFEHVQPGQRWAPPAAMEWNAVLDAGRKGLGSQPGGQATAGGISPQTCTLKVINKTGAGRNRYEAIALGEPRWELRSKDSLPEIVIEAEAADPAKPLGVLQVPLREDGVGLAAVSGPSILKFDTIAGSPEGYGRAKSNHLFETAESGPIRIIKAVSAGYGLGIIGSASAVPTGHYLFTLTGAMSAGTGAATIRNMADTDEIETGATVVDTLGLFDGLASGKRGICIKEESAYYAIGPYVTRVRWDDPDLEFTKDGGDSWENIDTAEDCS